MRSRHAARPRARQLQPIYNPTQPLAGGPLKQAANALTNLEIRPQVSALARQIAATNRQGQAVQDKTAGYFAQLGGQAQQALTAQQGVSQRLNAALQGIGSQTQQQIGDAGSAAQAQLAPLQQQGLDGGSFAQLAKEIAAQRALAATNAQTSQTYGAQQGANFEGLTANQIGTGALRGQERLGEIGNATLAATAEARGRKADLLASRGSLFTKNLGALRDSERNYKLAVDTLGANVQNNLLDAASQRASLKQQAHQFNIQQALRDQQFQLDYSKYGLDIARDNYQRAHGLGPYKPAAGLRRTLNPNQQNAAFGDIDSATTAIRQLRDQGLGTSAIRQALANGYYPLYGKDANGRRTMRTLSVPRVGDKALVNAAMDLAILGYLSPANVKSLHRYGLKVGGRYRYLKGHRPPPGGVGPPSPVYG